MKKAIFDKTCKCGNHMVITVSRPSDREVEITGELKPDYSYSVYLVGDSTAECADCHKRYRSYHHAYSVEARTWPIA